MIDLEYLLQGGLLGVKAVLFILVLFFLPVLLPTWNKRILKFQLKETNLFKKMYLGILAGANPFLLPCSSCSLWS